MLCLVFISVLAQVDVSIEDLNLDQAVALGLEHSSVVRRAELSVDLANLNLGQSTWWRRILPRLGLGASYDPVSGESDFGIGLGLNLQEILLDVDEAREARIQKIDREAYLLNVRHRVEQEIAEAFFSYQLARSRASAYEVKVQDSLKLIEIAKLRFEEGMLGLSDLLQAEEGLLTDRLGLLQAQASVFLAELRLRRMLGVAE